MQCPEWLKRRKAAAFICVLLLAVSVLLYASAEKEEKQKIRVLIVPKFEIGAMSGDFPGEAQLFYERYCAGCGEIEMPNFPPTAHFYLNDENGVGILVTGSGKTAAGLSLMALLSSDRYDCSGACIVSVGCGGGSLSVCTPGDVVLVTAACDFDLGHHVDIREMENENDITPWFPDDSYSDYEFKTLNPDLCEKAYQMTKDVPLQSTELTRRLLEEAFRNMSSNEKVLRDPKHIKGTALSGDNYWKGVYGHFTADYIAEYYGSPDPYAVTEMEEIAVANTAECFGILDRVISFRVIVNLDVFIGDETPESTWGEYNGFNEKILGENDETFDIFESAMHNLFDTASVVIDAILDGSFILPPA